MSQDGTGLRSEELAAERMLADVRIILSLTSLVVGLRLIPEVEVDYLGTIISLVLFQVYSAAMFVVVRCWPKAARTAAAISSFVEVGLITALIWATWFNSISPFYLWYVFYIVSIATRYGGQYTILGLALSLVLYTTVSMAPSHYIVFVPGFLGSTGFLFVLAFLFGHMSDRQRSYQKLILVANDFGIHLASLPSSREMIDHLVEQAAELLELEKCWFVQTRGGDEAPVAVASFGTDIQPSEAGEIFGDWSPTRILSSNKTLVLNRLQKDQSLLSTTMSGLVLKSLACVPMFVRDTPVGVLYAANRPPRGFSKYDVQLLQLLANQAAPVIENSQLWEQLKDAAAAEERLRIARDLHDSFLQTLAAVKLYLERCRIQIDKDPEKAKNTIGRLSEISTQGLAEVRTYLSELRLAGPEPSRVGEAIEHSAKEAASRAGFEARIDVRIPETGLSPQLALATFQVARELLNNAAKHASAKNVRITVRTTCSELKLDYSDDGVGFNPPSDYHTLTSQGHLGLAGVSERINALSGTLTVKSSPGNGTAVEVVLPLEDPPVK